MKRLLRRSKLSLAALTITAIAVILLVYRLAAGYIGANSPVNYPIPTGQHMVGRTSFHWVDQNRDDPFTADPTDRRELMVYVWYPADVEQGARPGSWLDAAAAAGILDAAGIPADRNRLVHVHSYLDAPVSGVQGTYPVVVMSHGDQGIPFLYTAYAEELASHGYIVAAISHTYNATATVFPDGRVLKALPGASAMSFLTSPPISYAENLALLDKSDQLAHQMALDIAFVLERLRELSEADPRFAHRLDLAKVGVMGHSLGGAAAFEALNRVEGLKAGVNLDGSLYSTFGLVRKPYMTISTVNAPRPELSDRQLKRQGWTRAQAEDLNNRFAAMRTAFEQSPMAYMVTMRGAAHNNFTDMGLLRRLSPVLDDSLGKIDARYAHKITNEYLVAFFDRHLLEKDGAALRLPPPYPEVMLEWHDRR